MNKIEIQILSREEMNNAHELDDRYQGVDETNLGFSDPLKNRVYVIASKDKELMQYLINHEVEHLFEEKGTHEDEHGIRHKKGGFFQNFILPSITGGLAGKGSLFGENGVYGSGIGFNSSDSNKKSETVSGSNGMEGLSNSPFGNFTVGGGTVNGGSSPNVSQTVTGGVQSGGLQPGISGLDNQGSGELSPELLQKLKGNYAGRMVF